MFRTVFTKSLRDYRWAILGWGIGLGLLAYVQYATYSQLYGSAVSRAELQQLGQQFRFFATPIRLDTPGGYTTFRAMGPLPVLLGIWTILAGARMMRGDEDRGSADILLSAPQSRMRIFVQKALALVTAVVIIALLIALWLVAGMASASVTIDVGAAVLAGLNTALVALVFGMLALLLSQVMSRGAAAGWTGGLMAFFYMLDGALRVAGGEEILRRVSPFFYYQLSKPLISGYGTDWGAFAVLLALCVIGLGLSVPLFLRRDMGRSALADVTWGRRQASQKTSDQIIAEEARSVWVRGIGTQALRRQAAAIFWWVIALALISGYLVIVAQNTAKQIQDLLKGSPFFQQFTGGADIGTNSGFLSALVFTYMPVVVAIFAGLIAYRWATDLESGRMELVLGTPLSRWRVVLERYGVVLVAAVAAPLSIWLAITLFAQVSGFRVDVGAVAVASFGMVPLELITASLVFALAGLIQPGAVIGAMSAFLGVSFLAEVLKTLLNLPGWALNLSVFHQYGTPIIDGLNWGAFAVMVLIAGALLAVGGWQFSARDVEGGTTSS